MLIDVNRRQLWRSSRTLSRIISLGRRRMRPPAVDVICHIGSTTELTNSLRNQPTNMPHTPVTSASPTATSIIPPTI